MADNEEKIWYGMIQGKSSGPFSERAILRFLESGYLGEESTVRHRDGKTWVKVSDRFEELDRVLQSQRLESIRRADIRRYSGVCNRAFSLSLFGYVSAISGVVTVFFGMSDGDTMTSSIGMAAIVQGILLLFVASTSRPLVDIAISLRGLERAIEAQMERRETE